MGKGRVENLKPFKPGVDDRRNTYGAHKGSQQLGSIFNRLLAKRMKMEEDGEIVEMTRKEAIALRAVLDAFTDDDPNIRLKAAKMIFDTTDPITKDVALTMNTVEGQKILSPEDAAKIIKIAGG